MFNLALMGQQFHLKFKALLKLWQLFYEVIQLVDIYEDIYEVTSQSYVNVLVNCKITYVAVLWGFSSLWKASILTFRIFECSVIGSFFCAQMSVKL